MLGPFSFYGGIKKMTIAMQELITKEKWDELDEMINEELEKENRNDKDRACGSSITRTNGFRNRGNA